MVATRRRTPAHGPHRPRTPGPPARRPAGPRGDARGHRRRHGAPRRPRRHGARHAPRGGRRGGRVALLDDATTSPRRTTIVDAALRSVAEREIERLAAAAARAARPRRRPGGHRRHARLARGPARRGRPTSCGPATTCSSRPRDGPQLAEIHLAWARAVQRLAEEVLRAAGSPCPGLDARLLAAAIDGLRLEQLTMAAARAEPRGRVRAAGGRAAPARADRRLGDRHPAAVAAAEADVVLAAVGDDAEDRLVLLDPGPVDDLDEVQLPDGLLGARPRRRRAPRSRGTGGPSPCRRRARWRGPRRRPATASPQRPLVLRGSGGR